VTSSYSNDFIYITPKGRESLCAQTNSSRVILIRPSYFLHDSPLKMREIFYMSYSKFFCFEDTTPNSIKFVSLTDDPNFIELYSDDDILIRDVKDKSNKKDLYRQLVYKKIPNEIESEMKLYNVPEQDSKSSTYKPVKTSKQYKGKKLKTCSDVNFIISHFIKIAISSVHFLDCSNWNTKPLEILILGASVGTLPYFTKRVYKDYVKITAVEENEKLKEMGKEYFGFDTVEYDWKHMNGLKYINSRLDHNKSISKTLNEIDEDESKINNINKKKKKIDLYDLIMINENSLYAGNKISPTKELMTKEGLENIKVRLALFIFFIKATTF